MYFCAIVLIMCAYKKLKYACSLVNQTALLGDGAYRLEIISASLLKGLVYLADTTCSADLQIL